MYIYYYSIHLRLRFKGLSLIIPPKKKKYKL